MRFFGYWTVFVALVISAVAAYYSIVGLVAIFAAAMTPIVIMGTALEVGKLTTAVWLHTFWDKAEWHIKSYLSIALILLMFITSMGIFGFLSKAHIEQTAQATEGTAQIERIEDSILRNEQIIARAEQQIEKLSNSESDQDAGLQEKIDSEQSRIDTAYDRIQPAIDEQKQLLEQNLAPYETQLASANEKLDLLKQYADANDVRALQRLVGARADGQYGPGTAAKVEEFRATVTTERDTTLAKMQELRDASSTEILRIRGIAEQQIADSNKLINRLRDQLGRNDNADQLELDINEQRARIKEANTEIDTLFERKFELETQIRGLEAEVGPVKYIAELVYGEDASKDSLEQAVRWVIIILVIVFDPLAVVLIIAGITLVEHANKKKTLPNTPKEKHAIDISHATAQEIISDIQEEIQSIHDELHDTSEYVDSVIKDIAEEPAEANAAIKRKRDRDQEFQNKKEAPLHEDEGGKYKIDEFGNKLYVYSREQLDLNSKARDRDLKNSNDSNK